MSFRGGGGGGCESSVRATSKTEDISTISTLLFLGGVGTNIPARSIGAAFGFTVVAVRPA